MVSRLLSALDARIAQSRDVTARACLRAERAALLARLDRLADARAELAVLRASFESEPNAVVSAWSHLAEGLVINFENLGASAHDRMKRARALGEAAGSREVQALSAAWLAQLECSSMDFEPMRLHLAEALRTAADEHHSARSRACLVAAEAYHWAERLDLALPWYGRAHRHATAEGDDATLSALMHNMAWLRTAEARRRSVVGALGTREAREAQLGAESLDRFDGLIGGASLASWTPILRAQVLLLQGEFASGLALLEAHLQDAVAQGLGWMACVMHADIAWSRLQTGDADGARRAARLALDSLGEGTYVDDVAMTHSRLAQIATVLGATDDAQAHSTKADAAWRAHERQQAQLIPALTRALDGAC